MEDIGVGVTLRLVGMTLGIWLVWEFFAGRCPLCGGLFSFKETTEKRPKPALLFGTKWEYKKACKKCGYERWKLDYPGR